MQSVVETPDYLRDVKAAGIGEDEARSIVNFIAADPQVGDLIVGSGGSQSQICRAGPRQEWRLSRRDVLGWG